MTCLLMPATVVLAQDWEIEVADYGKDLMGGTDRSLRVDEDGNPHVAYGGARLYYAFSDGSTWQYEVADPAMDVGRYASLALDRAGNPHISYIEQWYGHLKYAYRDASGWHVRLLTQVELCPAHP